MLNVISQALLIDRRCTDFLLWPTRLSFWMLSALMLCAIGWPVVVFAAAPIITNVADQMVALGNTYLYKPTLQQGGVVNWSKLYGPDGLEVDPVNGNVTWSIPSNLPSESFHIGVQASNAEGVAREVWIVHVGVSKVIEVGPNTTYKTLRNGFAALNGGETMVIKAGTYTGVDNTFGLFSREKPPSGTVTKLTTVMSEQPGSVILDGQGERNPLVLISDFVSPLSDNGGSLRDAPANYIALKGIEVHNSSDAGLEIRYAHHIKLIDLGAANSGGKYQRENIANMVVNRSQYVTIEGLYTWGYSRYALSLYYSQYVINRRSTVRIDNFSGKEPVGGYQTYCSRHIRHQNNLILDSDHPEFWTNNIYWAAAFAGAATDCDGLPENIRYERSISLNNALSVGDTAAKSGKDALQHQDIVAWDVDTQRFDHGTSDAFFSVYNSRGSMKISQSTLGNIRQSGGPLSSNGQSFIFADTRNFTVENSIFFQLGEVNGVTIDQGPLISCDSVCSFKANIFYNFKGKLPTTTSVTSMTGNDSSTNPLIRYLPQLDQQSRLRTAGINNTRIGAEVMTYKGRSGTFWGDPGFEDETNLPMWPITNQHVISNAMSKWSYTGPTRNGGPTATLKGARGHASGGETITHYVWNYLGNLTPVFNLHAQGGNNSVLLLWDLPIAKYLSSVNGYRIYRIQNNERILVKEINDRNAYSATVDGLDNSTEYKFAVTSFNSVQESGYAYTVDITPETKAKPVPPVLSVQVN